MPLVCPHCQRRLEFAGAQPTFCGYCGQRLGGSTPTAVAEQGEPPTLSPRPLGETEIVSLDPAAHPPARDPDTVGQYRLVRRLGGGGMGTVYEAEDIGSGRRVAVKLVQPEYAASPEAISRFRREGELASKLSHPRCVFVLAADEAHGRPYIVMELMTGVTLADLVKQHGPLPPEEAIRKILDVIEGLQDAHRHGLIHRDVKPSNCFVEADGRVKVGDFGLAKSLLEPADLTRTGTFVGTPLFAAPEQIKRMAVDVRSDVYSVAATLYFLLTGRAPFQSDDVTATLARIMADPPSSMRTLRPELPKALDKVVLRGLERERKRRWRNLDEFGQALRQFLPVEPTVGGLGLRIVAYLLDTLVLIGPNLGIQHALNTAFQTHRVETAAELLVPLLLELAYFGVLEGIWGCSLGKRLCRLRVGLARDNCPPGLGRATLRAAVVYFLFDLGDLSSRILYAVLLPGIADDWDGLSQAQKLVAFAINLSFIGSTLLGIGLIAYTMRKRNGYRGLHELLSGTRTYRLHSPRTRRSLGASVSEFQLELLPMLGLPEKIGAYQIEGSLYCTANELVLRALDPLLRRTVWLWLRPATAPAVNEGRRMTSRATRARWLACGTTADKQWDAFLAPAGRPLPAVVAERGRLSWGEFRGILEDVVDELRAACADGSLPPTLTPQQIWVDAHGRAVLVDVPLDGSAPESATGTGAVGSEEARALALLADATVLALEGHAPTSRTPALPVRAPLPLYAREIANIILADSAGATGQPRATAASDAVPAGDGPALPSRLNRIHARLLATQSEPVEITRRMRASHLAGHAMFAFLGFMGMFAFVFGLPILLLRELNPDEQQPDSTLVAASIAVGAALFFVLTFLTWGGFSFLWEDRAVVRPDGRPASRLRCIVRTLLSWAFMAAIALVASLGSAIKIRWLGLGLIAFACVSFIGYLVLVLRNPARAPHDYLAGTCLVPK